MTFATSARAPVSPGSSRETAQNDNHISYSTIYFDNVCRIAALTRRENPDTVQA